MVLLRGTAPAPGQLCPDGAGRAMVSTSPADPHPDRSGRRRRATEYHDNGSSRTVETGSGYAAILEATGGDSGSYSWALVQKTVAQVSAFGRQRGLFSGSVPAVGEYGLTVDVEDGRGIVSPEVLRADCDRRRGPGAGNPRFDISLRLLDADGNDTSLVTTARPAVLRVDIDSLDSPPQPVSGIVHRRRQVSRLSGPSRARR